MQNPFLASSMGPDETSDDVSTSLAAKIFIAYRDLEHVTPAGEHAAQQLLLRMAYLIFEGSAVDSIAKIFEGRTWVESDFLLSGKLLRAARDVVVHKVQSGAKPLSAVFDRPILRRRISAQERRARLWTNHSSSDSFPSALVAAQEFSFGSTKVRHDSAVDDIQIANNIARSANGETNESYNYLWSWKDKANEIQRHLDRSSSFLSSLRGRASCGLGNLCASDTTLS